MGETVEVLVEGGKATPAPPIGPTLSPLGVNVGLVVKEINEKTKSFAGMQVPVKIVVDTATKNFTISVGTPPVSAMLKKKIGAQKLATVSEDKKRNPAGSVKIEDIIEIAKSKDSIKGPLKSKVKQVLGTCLSCGVLVENRDPREIIKEIDEGKIKVE